MYVRREGLGMNHNSHVVNMKNYPMVSKMTAFLVQLASPSAAELTGNEVMLVG